MKTWKNLVLILFIVALGALPLFMYRNSDDKEKFQGSDDRARDQISKIQPGYKQWFKPVFQPASSEIETLLFCLQAAIGAGFIGYYIGYKKGQHLKEQGK